MPLYQNQKLKIYNSLSGEKETTWEDVVGAAAKKSARFLKAYTEPIRNAKENITYYHANCIGIDTVNNIIHCTNALDENEFSLSFDNLVIEQRISGLQRKRH